jgi:hypothetical protein
LTNIAHRGIAPGQEQLGIDNIDGVLGSDPARVIGDTDVGR